MHLNNSNTIQAFWIALGSFVAFAFSIISAAILSRYLTKGDYGTYRQILYVYTSFLVIFSVGLPKAFAYFLPRVEMSEEKSLIKKITIVFLLLGFLFSMLLFFGSSIISVVLKNPDLEIGLKYFSLVPLFMLPTMGIEGIYSTLKKTYVIAIYTVVTRIGMVLFIVLPVLLYENDFRVAVIGFVVSSFLSFLMAIYLKNRPFRNIASVKTKLTYKIIFKFSMPLMYASIWGLLITSADQFFISRYFGNLVFAEFSNGSLQLPFVFMIANATSIVLQPIFSKMINEGGFTADILPLWRSTLEKSVIIIYPLLLFFWVFADHIMVLLYGTLYLDSAKYFRIMSIFNFFNIIAFAPVILALGATKYYSKIHLIIAITIWIVQFLVIKVFYDPYLVTVVSVICRSTLVIVLCIYIAKSFKIKFWDLFPIKTMSKIFISCSLILIVIKMLTFYVPFSSHHFIIVLLSFIIYAVTVFGSGRILKINYFIVFMPLFLKFIK